MQDPEPGRQSQQPDSARSGIPLALQGLFILFVLAVLGGYVLDDLLRKHHQAEWQQRSHSRAELLSEILAQRLLHQIQSDDQQSINPVLHQALSEYPALERLEVQNGDGLSLFSRTQTEPHHALNWYRFEIPIVLIDNVQTRLLLTWDADRVLPPNDVELALLRVQLIGCLLLCELLLLGSLYLLIAKSLQRLNRAARSIASDQPAPAVGLPGYAASEFRRLEHLLSRIRDGKQDQREDSQVLQQAASCVESQTLDQQASLSSTDKHIRSTMNTITGLCELALQEPPSVQQSNYFRQIDQTARLMAGALDDLLDASRLDSGQLVIAEDSFQLQDVLNVVSASLSVLLSDKSVELVFAVSPQTPETLIGDQRRLTQVLLHLARNAAEFTQQGEIVLSIAVAEPGNAQSLLYFSLRDSGCGIPLERQAGLLADREPSALDDHAETGRQALSLVYCRRLLELMRGRLWFESRPGAGSVFYFELPLQAPEKQASSPASLANLRVLLADHHDTARNAVLVWLDHLQMHVDVAKDGWDAYQRYLATLQKGGSYDVLIMDATMPVLDAVSCLQEMSQANDTLPAALIMTALGKQVDLSTSVPDKVRLLHKPVTGASLQSGLLQVLQLNESDAAQLTQASAQDGANDLTGAHILLVEDNDFNQELAIDLLKDRGIQVELAENGQEAIERFKAGTFDAILMDCQMPVLDGYLATQEIRRLPGGDSLPIIALTANNRPSDIEKTREAGMDAHLTKPIDVRKLFTTLTRYVRPRRDDQPGQVSAPPELPTAQAASLDLSNAGELRQLDASAALRRIEDNVALYHKMLGRFRDQQTDVVIKIREALAAWDVKQARLLAHTLKGIAGSIGAFELQKQSADLESAMLEDRAITNDDLSAISQAVSEVLADIEQLQCSMLEPASPAVTGAVSQDLPPLISRLATLQQYLDDHDADAISLLQDFADVEQPEIKQMLQEVAICLDRYDFEQAQTLLQPFLSEV